MYLETAFGGRSGTLAADTMPYLYLAGLETGVNCTCRARSLSLIVPAARALFRL